MEQQIELLRLKKEHIDNLMNFALGIKLLGVKHMDFKAFDRSKLDEYSRQAKELYGSYGGEGTAVFVANAIEIYCDKAE